VRTLQPVLEELDKEWSRPPRPWAPLPCRLLPRDFPGLVAALLTGFALAFARAVGNTAR